MKGTAGLPIGVQIATLPFEDEKCLSLMKQLDDSIQFSAKHKLPL